MRATLAEVAWATNCTRSYLGAQYHRLAGRRRKKKAFVAVAHSMLVITYHHDSFPKDQCCRDSFHFTLSRLMRANAKANCLISVANTRNLDKDNLVSLLASPHCVWNRVIPRCARDGELIILEN